MKTTHQPQRTRRKYCTQPGDTGLNTLYCNYRRNAKRSGREFLLTKEEFRDLTSQHCKYCGVEPTAKSVAPGVWSEASRERGAYIYNGVDRVDSRLGYTPENSVPCCYQCNRAKSDMSASAFESFLNRITKFRST
jgi:hypothetical protein